MRAAARIEPILLRLQTHPGNDPTACEIEHQDLGAVGPRDMERQAVPVKRQVRNRRTGRNRERNGRIRPASAQARRLIDHGRHQHNEAAEQENPHHHDGDLQHARLAGIEYRARQGLRRLLRSGRHVSNPMVSVEKTDILTVAAEPSDAGQRLDRFLSARLPQLSRARLQALIRQGHARGDGETIMEPAARVKPGVRYEIEAPPPSDAVPGPELIPLDIVYEDDQLVVIQKPAGIVVHPGAGNWSGTLVNALIAHCGDSLSGIGGVRRPGIVHRLDKDTSGLMVAAKTDAAHRALARQFADHGRTGRLERRYLALVWGVPRPRQGRVAARLGRQPRQRQKMAVLRDGGREAATYYRVVQELGGGEREAMASLVECRLETGRTHQVRVHMAHLGHPLIGDALYGAGFKSKTAALLPPARAAVAKLGRQALHAAVLAFVHPRTGELMRFESPLPPDMTEVLKCLSEG